MSVANERLEKLSMTDSLTGLLNRRKFDELSLQQWNISKQNSSPISIIMSDIDSFKRYNDHFGHQIGDECILQIANAISIQELVSAADQALYKAKSQNKNKSVFRNL